MQTGLAAQAAHDQCLSEVRGGTGPIAGANKCNDPSCDETAAMVATATSSTCGGTGPTPAGPGPSPPTGPAPSAPGPSPPTGAAPAVKPTVPTLCASENQGACACGTGETGEITTYVFWHTDARFGELQRCIHTFNVPASGSPLPVVLAAEGYGQGPATFDAGTQSAAAR